MQGGWPLGTPRIPGGRFQLGRLEEFSERDEYEDDASKALEGRRRAGPDGIRAAIGSDCVGLNGCSHAAGDRDQHRVRKRGLELDDHWHIIGAAVLGAALGKEAARPFTPENRKRPFTLLCLPRAARAALMEADSGGVGVDEAGAALHRTLN